MKLSLVPKEQDYFRLFSELAANLDAAAQLLVKFMSDGDREHVAAAILEHEHVGDKIVHDIVRRLNKSFITPIDREDIYLLTTRADDIIDEINGLARRLEIVHAVPLRPDVPEIAGILADSLVEVEGAFDQMKAHNGVTEHSQRVRRLEKRGDVLYAEALHRLFTGEPNAIEVVKWVSIYEQLEDAIDRCKHLAESLESVVVKHS